jgi:hypothetical protein
MSPASAPKPNACRGQNPIAITRNQVVGVLETQFDYVLARGTMANARMRRQWKRIVTNMDCGGPRELLLEFFGDEFAAAFNDCQYEFVALALDRELDCLTAASSSLLNVPSSASPMSQGGHQKKEFRGCTVEPLSALTPCLCSLPHLSRQP